MARNRKNDGFSVLDSFCLLFLLLLLLSLLYSCSTTNVCVVIFYFTFCFICFFFALPQFSSFLRLPFGFLLCRNFFFILFPFTLSYLVSASPYIRCHIYIYIIEFSWRSDTFIETNTNIVPIFRFVAVLFNFLCVFVYSEDTQLFTQFALNAKSVSFFPQLFYVLVCMKCADFFSYSFVRIASVA